MLCIVFVSRTFSWHQYWTTFDFDLDTATEDDLVRGAVFYNTSCVLYVADKTLLTQYLYIFALHASAAQLTHLFLVLDTARLFLSLHPSLLWIEIDLEHPL